MKSIRRIAKTAAAGLVGASLVGGAAAQSNSLDLGDYPAPFVDEDGEVNTAVVVGEQASTIDVVGAINIAGSLGQDAFSTEQVSVEGSSYGFTASQGVTLSTENDDLYFGDTLTEVRDTLTREQLSTLEEVTFRDDSGDETDIEQYLYPASNAIKFGKPDERDDEDPVVYVENPEDPDNNDFLFRLQANFEDSLNFTSGDVQDEDLELFGNTYQVSSDSDSDEVVLNGARETVSVSTGNESSATVTVGGDEVTFEVVGVTDSDTAAISINGEVQEEDEDSDFTVNGENVRIDDIIQTNSDNSQGTVQLAVGSDQLVLQDGNTVQDEDGDDIEGLYSELQGTPSSLSGIDLYVGAEDDDQTYVLEGENYTHPMFPDYAFRFGGLNPDSTDDSGENTVEFTPSGDDTIDASFSSQGESVNIPFIHSEDVASSGNAGLADDDDDLIQVNEIEAVEEDEYFVADPGDFSRLWEVTDIDPNGIDTELSLRDAVTGDTVDVEMDQEVDAFKFPGDGYLATEIIDGQTYYFRWNANFDTINVGWGDGVQQVKSDGQLSTGGEGEGETSLYTALDTEGGAAIAFTKPTDVGGSLSSEETLEFPSTESTDAQQITLDFSETGLDVVENADETALIGGSDIVEARIGALVYRLQFDSIGTSDSPSSLDNLDLATDQQDGADTDGSDLGKPAAVFIEPEDDEDRERAYVTTSGYDTGEEELTVEDPTYTGAVRDVSTLESDDDVDAGLDFFGTYTEFDDDEQGSFTLRYPDGQAVAGAGFTSTEGSLDTGGSGSTSVQRAAGFPESALLDSEVTSSQRQNTNHILVGGPAVNTLVSDLAEANKTMTGSEYSEGDSMIQLVQGAFADGQSSLIVAGFSGEDTRQAANRLANADENPLPGQDQVMVGTGQ